MANIQDATKIEEKHLEDLYGIKAGADSLASILLAQKEKEEEFNTRMDETRSLWEKEKIAQKEEAKEQKEQKDKNRKREEEEDQYTTK